MNKPEIIIISALAESNRVMGKAGKVPWRIPHDSWRFRQLTLGHTVVMGRKTWQDDVGEQPMFQRRNIVVSPTLSQLPPPPRFAPPGQPPHELLIVPSIPEALAICSDQAQVFMVGGVRIFTEALDIADRLELTLVAGDFTGDTFFPEYQSRIGTEYTCVNKIQHFGFRYETYRRMSPHSS